MKLGSLSIRFSVASSIVSSPVDFSGFDRLDCRANPPVALTVIPGLWTVSPPEVVRRKSRVLGEAVGAGAGLKANGRLSLPNNSPANLPGYKRISAAGSLELPKELNLRGLFDASSCCRSAAAGRNCFARFGAAGAAHRHSGPSGRAGDHQRH